MEMETGGPGVVAGGRRIPRAGIDGGGTIYEGGRDLLSIDGGRQGQEANRRDEWRG